MRAQFLVPAGAGLLTAAACLVAGLRGFWPLTTFALAAFATVVTLRELAVPVRARMRERGEGALTALVESASRARRRFGGYVVHLGVVMVFVAVAASQCFVTHATRTLRQGEAMQLGRYTLRYDGVKSGSEPRRDYVAARIHVDAGGESLGEVLPRLNYYERMQDPIGTPSVRSTPREDLYISLLAFSQDGASVSLNTWVFPLVGWIWWSLPLFVLGTLVALWPQRRARVAVAAPAAPVAAAPADDARRGVA